MGGACDVFLFACLFAAERTEHTFELRRCSYKRSMTPPWLSCAVSWPESLLPVFCRVKQNLPRSATSIPIPAASFQSRAMPEQQDQVMLPAHPGKFDARQHVRVPRHSGLATGGGQGGRLQKGFRRMIRQQEPWPRSGRSQRLRSVGFLPLAPSCPPGNWGRAPGNREHAWNFFPSHRLLYEGNFAPPKPADGHTLPTMPRTGNVANGPLLGNLSYSRTKTCMALGSFPTKPPWTQGPPRISSWICSAAEQLLAADLG